jgi:hypothetical protein
MPIAAAALLMVGWLIVVAKRSLSGQSAPSSLPTAADPANPAAASQRVKPFVKYRG